MKKLLSVMVTAMMLVSVLVAVPASAADYTFGQSPAAGVSFVKKAPTRYEFDEALVALSENEATNTADVQRLLPSVREMTQSAIDAGKVSGTKMMFSAQGAPYVVGGQAKTITRAQQELDPITFTFNVELPYTAYYDATYLLAKSDGGNTDTVTLTLDKGTENEVVIGNSTDKGNNYEDVSDMGVAADGTAKEAFPWGHMHMARRTTTINKALTAGTHTLTVDFKATTKQSTAEEMEKGRPQWPQPHMFGLDYIDFIPTSAGVVSTLQGTSFEFEKFANSFTAVEGKPGAKKSPYTSEGGYIAYDGGRKPRADYNNDITAYPPLETTLTLDVKETGTYSLQLAASNVNSPVIMRLDDKTADPFFVMRNWQSIYTKTTTETRIDPANKVPSDANAATSVWPYFQDQWHPAYYYTQTVTLEQGLHTIYVSVLPRPLTENNIDIYNVAICLDNFIVTPCAADSAVISSDKASRIEMENYAKFIKIPESNDENGVAYTANNPGAGGLTDPANATKFHTPVVASGGDLCSGGKFLQIDSATQWPMNTKCTFEIPITVETAGAYNVEYVTIPGNSNVRVYVDSIGGTKVMDTKDNPTTGHPLYPKVGEKSDTCPVFKQSWTSAERRFSTAELPAGTHKLVFEMEYISNSAQFAKYIDYIDFVPANQCEKSANKVTALANFNDIVTGTAILALYNGEELVKIETVDVYKTKYLEIETTVEDTVTNAKIFVWDGLDNIIPQTTPVELTFS